MAFIFSSLEYGRKVSLKFTFSKNSIFSPCCLNVCSLFVPEPARVVLIPRWERGGDELLCLNQPASLLDGWRNSHSRYNMNLHTISTQRCKQETLDILVRNLFRGELNCSGSENLENKFSHFLSVGRMAVRTPAGRRSSFRSHRELSKPPRWLLTTGISFSHSPPLHYALGNEN